MVKEPVAGRVKTRLAREIGAPRAIAFYRHATAALLGRLAHGGRWRTSLAVAPDPAVRSRAWDEAVPRIAQRGGDLGQRMQRIMDGLPPGPVVIVGSDIPGIRAVHIAEAFRLLGNHDAVLGPADDGGYWLVGFKRIGRIPRPFANVRWSSAQTLADTLAGLSEARVALTAIIADVDTASDLAAVGGTHGRRVPAVR